MKITYGSQGYWLCFFKTRCERISYRRMIFINQNPKCWDIIKLISDNPFTTQRRNL